MPEYFKKPLCKVLRTSAVVAALSVGACAVIAAQGLRTFANSTVQLDVAALSQWNSVHWKSDRSHSTEDGVTNAVTARLLSMQLPKGYLYRSKKIKVKIQHTTTQPVNTQMVRLAAEAEAKLLAAPSVEKKILSEAEKIQSLHLQLKEQFKVAVNTQSVSTQVAVAAVEVIPPVIESHPQPLIQQKQVSQSQPSIQKRIVKRKAFHIHHERKVEEKADQNFAVSKESVSSSVMNQMIHSSLAHANVTPTSTTMVLPEYSPAPILTPTLNHTPDTRGMNPGLPVTLTQKPVQAKLKPIQNLNTLPASFPVFSLNTQAVATNRRSLTDSEDITPAWVFNAVEAFQERLSIQGASRKILTLEGSDDQSRSHWEIAEKEGYRPTWSWVKSTHESIPLISENTLLTLFENNQKKLENVLPSSGIVFGHVPREWTLALSARSEAVEIFPNVYDARINDFIFINVEPGAHILTMESKGRQARANIVIPVVSGVSTYLALEQPVLTTLQGTVTSAMSGQMSKEFSVSVTAQPEMVSITNQQGEFKIENVWIEKSYPIYLDYQTRGASLHRSRVQGFNNEIRLYSFEQAEVSHWIEQLQGGINDESALIIGALPKYSSKESAKEFMPAVSSYSTNETMVPETYAVSSQEYLRERMALDEDYKKFISIQVPQGAASIQLTDRSLVKRWSQMIYASPRVLCVVAD